MRGELPIASLAPPEYFQVHFFVVNLSSGCEESSQLQIVRGCKSFVYTPVVLAINLTTSSACNRHTLSLPPPPHHLRASLQKRYNEKCFRRLLLAFSWSVNLVGSECWLCDEIRSSDVTCRHQSAPQDGSVNSGDAVGCQKFQVQKVGWLFKKGDTIKNSRNNNSNKDPCCPKKAHVPVIDVTAVVTNTIELVRQTYLHVSCQIVL